MGYLTIFGTLWWVGGVIAGLLYGDALIAVIAMGVGQLLYGLSVIAQQQTFALRRLDHMGTRVGIDL